MVFLLGRMGDNRKALRMLIERIGNVHRVSLRRLIDNTSYIRI